MKLALEDHVQFDIIANGSQTGNNNRLKIKQRQEPSERKNKVKKSF